VDVRRFDCLFSRPVQWRILSAPAASAAAKRHNPHAIKVMRVVSKEERKKAGSADLSQPQPMIRSE
jgi:hypothetical protein